MAGARPLSTATMPSRIDWKALSVALPILLMALRYPPSGPFHPLQLSSAAYSTSWFPAQLPSGDCALLPVSADYPSEPSFCLAGPADSLSSVLGQRERGIQPDAQPACRHVEGVCAVSSSCFLSSRNLLSS